MSCYLHYVAFRLLIIHAINLPDCYVVALHAYGILESIMLCVIFATPPCNLQDGARFGKYFAYQTFLIDFHPILRACVGVVMRHLPRESLAATR